VPIPRHETATSTSVSAVSAGTARYRQAAATLLRRLPDGLVLAPISTSTEPVVVDETGALVWDLLGRPCSVDELVDELLDVREGDPEVIGRDVIELVESLVARGLLIAL
jgi:Coenzyme PQQ synthesis protein D (PqqD)